MNKFLILVLAMSMNFLATAGANGEEVVIDGSAVEIEGDSVILVRTAQSPSSVTLKKTVQTWISKCVKKAIRTVDGPHPSCGQYTVDNVSCHDPAGEDPMGGCRNPSPFDSSYTSIRDHSCVHDEIYCAEFERIYDEPEERVYTVKFTKVARLYGDQRERFEFSVKIIGEKYPYVLESLKVLEGLKKYKVLNYKNQYTVKKTFFQF